MNTTTMQQNKTRDIVFIGIFAALIAICSWISIPTTVPFTLQTMGVFTAVGLLGGKRGSLAVLVYILLGLVGLPVFAGFPAVSAFCSAQQAAILSAFWHLLC